MTNADECAFPNTIDESKAEAAVLTIGGLTKREYFAALAMQGLRASRLQWGIEEHAEIAVEQADALIAELNKEKDSVEKEASQTSSAC